jgi:hypothetical protein
MLILLNTKVVLRQPISTHLRLKGHDKTVLLQFEITGSGTGIHWPALDEDLSLKGFLRDALKQLAGRDKDALAA